MHALTSTIAQAGELTGTQLLLRLIMFYFVGIILFVVGIASQQRRNGKGRWIKYVFGTLPIVGAIFFSMEYFQFSLDSFNRSAGILNDQREVLYRASPFISLGVLAIMIVGGIIADKRFNDRNIDLI